jgi:ABC-2 type transport system permease protein
MEAVDNQVLSLEWIRKAIIWPFKFFSPDFRVIAGKEITTFLRDPAIFSQIFMMTAIIFVYGYNLSILPLKDIPTLYSGELNDTLVFLNGPFIGFIIASIGMRFVFPSISMEGRAFWAVKSSPVNPKRILTIKLFVYIVPMILLGLILCGVTNSVFQVSHPALFWLSFINVILITLVITSLAISVGAIYADFSADSPLKIAGSYGGFIYMVLSGLYIINLLLLEIYPMYRFFHSKFYMARGHSAFILMVVSAILLLACTAAWVYLPFRKGLETIENYEPD